MEVEVKLRVLDFSAHCSLLALLSPFLVHTQFQHNLFFDGPNSELSSVRAILCLRLYGYDPETIKRCILCLKGNPVIVDGVSTVGMDIEELDPVFGRAISSDPNLIWSVEGRLLERVSDEFGVTKGSEYVCLGGFRNVRRVYEWNGLKLDVDETLFEFGTLYEIECESSEPKKAKEMIEDLLTANAIAYSYSKLSKFEIFRAGKLPI